MNREGLEMTDTIPVPQEAGFGPVPLLLGVTGHRDLRKEDLRALGEKVRTIFRELRAALPRTPLVVLTPLAEGADRLVARAALEEGARLYVPLPMPRALYETDFTTPESRAEFDELFARADYTVEMPLVSSEAEVRQPGTARNKQYDAVGEFVARHSQILIALWDGNPSAKPGGTADIVGWRLTELPRETTSRLHPPDPVRSGPVYHVVTPRSSGAVPPAAFEVRRLLPEGGPQEPEAQSNDWRRVRAEAQKLYGDMDEFNRDAAEMDPDERAAVARSRGYLFPDEQAARLPAGLRFTRECFAVADVLAVKFGRKTLWSHRLIYLLVFLAVATYEASGDLFGVFPVGLLLYPLILAAAGVVYWRAVRHYDFQNNYHDYRAVAEGLRVQFFWRLGGLTEPVEEHYLRQQRRELNWVRRALRIVWGVQGGGVAPTDTSLLSHAEDWLVKHWVEDQRDYFNRKAIQEATVEKWYKRAIWAFLVLGLTLSLVVGVGLLAPDVFGGEIKRWMEEHTRVEGLLLFLTSMPLITAGLLHAYRKAVALGSHVKQYLVMVGLFTNAANRLELLTERPLAPAQRQTELRALIAELGKEALVENGDWVLLNRDRPLEVPTAR